MRGHRDNVTDLEMFQGLTIMAIFLALLNFRIEAGDTVLGEHLCTSARNAIYISNTVQNQIIDVLVDQIRQIIQKVQAAKWYTVIADEVTDISNKEQLSIVLSYVESDSLVVREDIVGFTECDTGISGQNLADKITTLLEALGLDLSNLRGQAYDGAGNMAGSINGTAAIIITAQYPFAIYWHCASLCLNLAIVKSLELTSVRNMMGVVGRVYHFFAAHPKHQRALEKAISDCQPSSTAHKLKDMCRTRWVQQIDAIEIFTSLHQSIVGCMGSICNDGPGLWNADSITLAITTDFLCALVITLA